MKYQDASKMRYADASKMRYADASKPWDPRAKQAGPALSRRAGTTAAVATFAPAAAAQAGNLPPPANAAAAAGNSPLNVPQGAMAVGEPIPVIWGRRRGTVGGVLVFPRATEARFENTSTTVTSRYHMVLGEGLLPDVQRRDVRLGECRIGDFSQNYNQRAGSWIPGNFATAQTGYTVPTFTNYTGGGGNYQGLSTFEAGVTIPGGSDDWRTGWNVFLRGGTIVERGRLIDSTVASSDNIADLALWALQRSGRMPDGMIDFPSMLSAATFTEAVGLWCNGEFSASGNLGDWLIRILPDFLLRETKVGGRFGIRPLLPTNANGTINTGSIEPKWLLTEGAIVPDSYQIEYSDAASRRPVAMAMLWRQQHDDSDVPIVRTLTVGDPNASGPVEQHDISQFATTENHAAKVGAYLYARRTLSTHTATVRLKPGGQTGTISEGDILQIYLGVTTSRESPGVINRYYQVESISHSLTGEESLALSHFPVNAESQSLIALAVANATGPGIILSSNRTGSSCDLAGASSSTEVPAKSSIDTSLFPPGLDLPLSLGGPGSPPGPGGGDSAKGSPGNPFGALPRPENGKNAAGGDPICPTGYESITTGGTPSGFAGVFPAGDTVEYSGSYSPNGYTSIFVCYYATAVRTFGACSAPRETAACCTFRAFGNNLSFGVSLPALSDHCGVQAYNGNGYITGADPSQGVITIGNDGGFGQTMYAMLPGGRWTVRFRASDSATAVPISRAVTFTCNGSAPVTGILRTVVKGDTLWDIAQDEYNDATRWPEIYAANTDVIGADPDLIFPGQVLRIP